MIELLYPPKLLVNNTHTFPTLVLLCNYGTSTIVRYLMPNASFIHIKSSISNNSMQHNYSISMSNTVLYQVIQFSLSIKVSSI